MGAESLKEQAKLAIDEARDEVVELSRKIQANPETAYQEVRAARWVSDTLQGHDFEVQRGLGGLDTAFGASLKGGGPGPVIALILIDARQQKIHAKILGPGLARLQQISFCLFRAPGGNSFQGVFEIGHKNVQGLLHPSVSGNAADKILVEGKPFIREEPVFVNIRSGGH